MKRCCCDCCTVRTGTLIIGILTLISAIYQVGKYCVIITLGFQELCILGNESAREIKYPVSTDDEINDLIVTYKIGIGLSFVGLLIYLIQLCLTISLFQGVSKDNHRLILPWYYFNLVMFVFGAIAMAILTVSLVVKGELGVTMLIAVITVLLFWLGWHFLSVVKDYIDELQTGYKRENLTIVIPAITTGKTEKA